MLKLSQPNIDDAAIAAVVEVLRSGQLVHGQECEAFEKELAEYLGCGDVILVSSGTSALHVALMALDIGEGDAVIVPDFTFPATANVVALTGAKPVIVDVLPGTYTLDRDALESLVTGWRGPERLRAIMPVHEFGCPADMTSINRIAEAHGLAVIEDAACALGATYAGGKAGNLADIGCFSFHPRKTLTTGEGGAIATRHPELATRMRRLRNHGMERISSGMQFFEPATNYRLTNFQAALGRQQLPHLDEWIQTRRDLAKGYLSNLAPLVKQGLLTCPAWDEGHSWQTFMVVLNPSFVRSEVIAALREHGVESNLGAQSLSVIGIYGDQAGNCIVGPQLYASGLALPLFEQMSTDDVQKVCTALIAVLG
ncbi:dTDP-4-amino-4,6-dideoxygalactose transaminase [Pseudomonas sp. SLBN-26]|uniref:DegT/DnrJ/EryC1/StrS family aminotransferase n=1 Tax=Pseudomonadaceae TaxID=135621 RepID=UPI0011501091|nr:MULTISPECIES: DegT/DnrJ/EryC1/StrS family aminotransferase [Pseudomonas]MCP1621159.1 dTDP-4-amino-4,6-dideoxygalactose transaminase [Pseudomonas otitidis]TQL10363.1 dTDP-4-amino-4,6-dideoxygalactose transaminase [Pseudomonas sp. SLBN-26]